MSETPRTDNVAMTENNEFTAFKDYESVPADFARQLERDLAATRSALLREEKRCSERTMRVAELEATIVNLTDSECDKVMALTDAQVEALCRMTGHDPEDKAQLAKQACELALLKTRLAEVEHERDDARFHCVDETRVVDRIWSVLGISTYEQAKPYAIHEHVEHLKQRAERYRKALEVIAWRRHALPPDIRD